MAGTHIVIDYGGLTSELSRLTQLGQDMTPAMRDAGEYFLRRTEQRFNAEQGPGGAHWAALKASTLARKRHTKILTERARLRGSFSYRAEPDGLTFGTSVIYAAIHQFGGTIERGAYSSTARLRTDAKGDLLRHRAIFAKNSHKRVRSVRYTTDGFSVGIPARPFLGVDEEDSAELQRILLDHVARRAGGR